MADLNSLRAVIAAVRRWLRPPRRLQFTRSGGAFSAGALAIGFAAINTGNNLLYLLLGGVLGFIAVSGWLSEQMLRGAVVRRRIPRGVTVAVPARITYEVHNRKQRLPSLALEISEPSLPGQHAYITEVEAGGTARGRIEVVFHRRGVIPLNELTLGTSFPFGFFHKSRDIALPGSVLVWPRHDLRLREPRPAGRQARLKGRALASTGGGRGEYRGLRDYRPGDDPRDVHWPSSARRREPIVREYERDDADELWICLDLQTVDAPLGERTVEIAASLAAAAAATGKRFGLATADAWVNPGAGAHQLERVLDVLARVEFRRAAGAPPLPGDPACCVLVTARAADSRFGDVFTPASLAIG